MKTCSIWFDTAWPIINQNQITYAQDILHITNCDKKIPRIRYSYKRACVFILHIHQNMKYKRKIVHINFAFNSLRPSDAIWRQWFWTTLAQVMACCLTAPSHYLNQCWLIIRGVLWHTSESSFAGIAQGIDSGYEFEKDILKNIFKSPRGQWVNSISLTHWGRVTNLSVSKLCHLWIRRWLVAYVAPSHYLNLWWFFVKRTHWNKPQCNIDNKNNPGLVYVLVDCVRL